MHDSLKYKLKQLKPLWPADALPGTTLTYSQLSAGLPQLQSGKTACASAKGAQLGCDTTEFTLWSCHFLQRTDLCHAEINCNSNPHLEIGNCLHVTVAFLDTPPIGPAL